MLSETTSDETEEPKEEEEEEATTQQGEEGDSSSSPQMKTAEGTQTESGDAASKFVAAGEGTVSDGKGSTKKVFFLQKKDGKDRPQWLKKMSDGLSSAGAVAGTYAAGAGDAVSRLVKKADEKKEAEAMEAEDKEAAAAKPAPERLKDIVAAGRASVETASSRLSGFVASMQKPDDGAAPDKTDDETNHEVSRLATFRAYLATRKEPSQALEDEVAALKDKVESLTAVVQSLAARLDVVEKANNITPPAVSAAEAPAPAADAASSS